MAPNYKAEKRKEANRIRSSNFRNNKETPDQAERRKKNESIRSAERQRRIKFTGDNISQIIDIELEVNDHFPYISKMVNSDETINRAFRHIMKTKIGADEYLNKDIREQIGLNVESTSKTKTSDSILDEIHQPNICVCCDRFIIGTEEINWMNKKILLLNKKKKNP